MLFFSAEMTNSLSEMRCHQMELLSMKQKFRLVNQLIYLMEILFVLERLISYSEKPSNKMINKFLLTLAILFLWVFVPVSAQVSFEKLENLENFPEFEFVIHDRNPENVNWENIKLFEISDTLDHKNDILSAINLKKMNQ